MPADLSRRGVTDLVIATIEAVTGKPTGDAQADTRCGWHGQPNATGSNFTPYTVVMPGTGSVNSGPFGDSQADWQLPYTVWAFGVKRKQCEALADLARDSLMGIRGQTLQLKDQKYSVMQVKTDTIGGINRYDQTDPAYFGEMDVVTVWLTKERN